MVTKILLLFFFILMEKWSFKLYFLIVIGVKGKVVGGYKTET